MLILYFRTLYNAPLVEKRISFLVLPNTTLWIVEKRLVTSVYNDCQQTTGIRQRLWCSISQHLVLRSNIEIKIVFPVSQSSFIVVPNYNIMVPNYNIMLKIEHMLCYTFLIASIHVFVNSKRNHTLQIVHQCVVTSFIVTLNDVLFPLFRENIILLCISFLFRLHWYREFSVVHINVSRLILVHKDEQMFLL
jgi:hypothetical protein